MNISKKEFAEKIVTAVRKECENQKITQGAIAVSFAGIDNISESFTFPVVVGSSTVCYDKDGRELGDAAGVAAMKIASAIKAIEYHTSIKPYPGRSKYTSGALPEEFVGQGRTNWKGGIGVPIGILIGGHCGCMGTELFKICVAVSGGSQDQDEVAAWAALDVIREVIDSEAGYMLGRDFLKKYDCVDGEVDRYQESSEG